MYLIIFEDGNFKHTGYLTEDCYTSCNAGDIDIVDISDPISPLYYHTGEWKLVPIVSERIRICNK